MRLKGIVNRINRARRLFFIWDGMKEYLTFYSDVIPDDYGNKHLILNEEVEFTPSISDKGMKAIDVQPQRPETPFDPDYTDTAIVTEMHPGAKRGWAERPSGTTILFYKSDVTTYGELKIGSMFRFRPERPESGYVWRAREIEIYQELENAEK